VRRQEKAAIWSRRYKLNVERLASADLGRVMQAVADLERRDQDTGLTPGEGASWLGLAGCGGFWAVGRATGFLGSGIAEGGFPPGVSRTGASQRRGRAGVNVEHPQRVSARMNDVEARKAGRRLGWPGGPLGHGPKSCSPSLAPSRKTNRSRSPRSWARP
jgi:hypothetical protein